MQRADVLGGGNGVLDRFGVGRAVALERSGRTGSDVFVVEAKPGIQEQRTGLVARVAFDVNPEPIGITGEFGDSMFAATDENARASDLFTAGAENHYRQDEQFRE